MKRQKGFSLIELLIVVAIILIIAAIAIPNLLRSKMAANESSAAASVRSIVTAQVTFNTTYGIGYAADLPTLGGAAVPCTASSTAACLIDVVLSSGTKSGFNVATVGAAQSFVATAVPVKQDVTGSKGFCADETLVVRFQVPWGGTVPGTDTACEAWQPMGN